MNKEEIENRIIVCEMRANDYREAGNTKTADRYDNEKYKWEKLLDDLNYEREDYRPYKKGYILSQQRIEELQQENQKLKKQIEEWEHHLKCSKEMLDLQGEDGNYNYDNYMLGLYNGMEYIIALFETREPNYINGKDVKFTSNKNQQKEFISYLEDWQKAVKKQYEGLNEPVRKGFLKVIIDTIEEILSKFKEIIGEIK